jgi:hypothetical protein
MTHSNDDMDPRTRPELSDEEQRTIVLDEMSGCWQRSIDRGAGVDTLAATALATAFTQIVDSYGRDAALAILDRFREQIAKGAFDPRDEFRH